jgi:hypothetical protein
MKGSYEVVVRNNRQRYKFIIRRNITILRGDSATGKTTLIDMIKNYITDGAESGIEVICDKKCVVLERGNWERDLKEYEECIVFIDEGNGFVKTPEFAEMVAKSTNYYVIATRDSLFNLPYSIEEIYGIRNTSANMYQGTKRLYSEFYHIQQGIDKTKDTPFAYNKSRLNETYLHDKNKKAVMDVVNREAGGELI